MTAIKHSPVYNGLWDKTILSMAKDIRKGILGKRNKSTNQCYKVCAPMATILGMAGCECDLVEGMLSHRPNNNHFWIRLKDGRILDPTANQFLTPEGNIMPEIYLGKKPVWYREING